MNECPQNLVKIAFRLERDEDGYPPADWEHLWARPIAPNVYEIDNIPFFAKGVAAGDKISVREEAGHLVFDKVVKSGGHSTIRVSVQDARQREAVRGILADLGCPSEASHLPNLFAVDVPAFSLYAAVLTVLEQKAGEGVLDYEEAAISQWH